MQLEELQKKYPEFLYEKYDYKIKGKDLEISFTFKIGLDIKFNPKIVIKDIDKKRLELIGKKIENLIFHLGLIEMISYWKATCSPEIIIKAGYLDKNQIKWWQDLIFNGMGEFFYTNKINFQKPCFKITTESKKDRFSLALKNRYLVPIGGGKDSIVTLELLKKAKKDIKCFSLNPTKAAKEVMKIGKCNNSITRASAKRGRGDKISSLIVERKIDKKLLELNQKGFLNGHTPFSAYLAFLTTLIAIIFDYKYIAVSNEKSANEGNVKYLKRIINHQWSKSFEFEKKFKNYCERYLAKDINYYSSLRKYTELEIAEMFSKYPKYFSAFLSCNKNIKLWCKKCPKCLFVFTILYPFIDDKDLFKIFGKNLFEDKKLLPIMQELIGKRGNKPFECVGTYKESKMALNLCLKKAQKVGEDKSSLPRFANTRVTGKIPYLLKKIQC